MTKSVGTGRAGRGSGTRQYPATGATAANNSARSAANRNAIAAPFEKPVRYTRRGSPSVRRNTSAIAALRNSTSSGPSVHRCGLVWNFGGLVGSGDNPSGIASANPSRAATADHPVSSSAHAAVPPVPCSKTTTGRRAEAFAPASR